MVFFAKLHPLIVHFPVGLLTSGVVFEIYGALRKDEVAETAGRFNIRLGFLCLFPVLIVGFLGMISLENTEKFRDFLATHLKFAFITAGVFISAMLVSRYLRKPRILYFLIIAVGGVCVLITGYFGGELVHRFGVSTH
ncbi:MAG: DUF2231 domain-containing protein [Nitrospina sp.]|jgi:uncharacterized membrane protein|nr:DUF2231 domain-containing protein [Nitrospina sp.]MBT3416069.1 DUF2231 domain-containing protein [Nitrospina sp.]MBT3856439.1 DUF2231 domain-containing protein [Nitrospina sp.]MBT4103511.1 DUF2231 domain-containing protein [Nitrospina sp.]MBT4389460.1 DUF2231 domain-containing protein [Nitrospina sp.]